ncbi:MAG: SLC13 family permease, partial [Fibrobacter sp.]|nr:SLC13 family permease [Fibrobacter sp.]
MRFFNFVKKEVVFAIALLAAVISSVIVHPSKGYSDYINWDVLFILFSLMAIIAGFRICGVFEKSAEFLCKKVHTLRAVSLLLITMCFFFSMLITNDVALLTFVPFTII